MFIDSKYCMYLDATFILICLYMNFWCQIQFKKRKSYSSSIWPGIPECLESYFIGTPSPPQRENKVHDSND